MFQHWAALSARRRTAAFKFKPMVLFGKHLLSESSASAIHKSPAFCEESAEMLATPHSDTSPHPPAQADRKTVSALSGSVVPSTTSGSTQEPDAVNFEFVEEPLGLTVEQNHGYLQVDFGETIGPAQRYEVIRKLGWGMYSSVWLARDRADGRYVAIKALTGYATRLIAEGYMQELVGLQRISSIPSTPGQCSHCVTLLAHFEHPGKDEDDGEHLCIVTDLMGPPMNTLRTMFPDGNLPVPLVKRILRHTLLGLAHMHRCGLVHTDLKESNILIDLEGMSRNDLESSLRCDPPRRHPPEQSWNHPVEVAASQPLPMPSLEQCFSRSFHIADFGSAQLVDRQLVDEITPPTLRAPETVLRGPWNEKVDIWVFGCLIFEFLTQRSLFSRDNPSIKAEVEHLFQMMCMTGERFMPDLLQNSKAALEYFDPKTCFLKARPRPFRVHYRNMIKTYKVTDDEDTEGAARLMEKCLRLSPKDRQSAADLLNDPWLSNT